MGEQQNLNANPFTGMLDELRFHERALSEIEVKLSIQADLDAAEALNEQAAGGTSRSQGRIFFDRQTLDGGRHVFVMDEDGRNETQLTFEEHNRHPAWSPDGSRIVFTRNDDIWIMQADGSGKTPILESSLWDRRPAWSPDGTRIVFMNRTPVGIPGLEATPWNIWVMEADGTGITQLTHERGIDPDWSPDGTEITYHSNGAIWLMNSDGTNQREISPIGHAPDWSPDGASIAFNFEDNLFVMNSDGSNRVLVTLGGLSSALWPDWSPDGKDLAFAGVRVGGELEIYAVSVEGADLIQLTENTAGDLFPAWYRPE